MSLTGNVSMILQKKLDHSRGGQYKELSVYKQTGENTNIHQTIIIICLLYRSCLKVKLHFLVIVGMKIFKRPYILFVTEMVKNTKYITKDF